MSSRCASLPAAGPLPEEVGSELADGETFAAAWNPNGMGLLEGMGSSISLTLWAFLGLESASQNASAVENPKRDVPLACLALAALVLALLAVRPDGAGSRPGSLALAGAMAGLAAWTKKQVAALSRSSPAFR